MAPRDENRQTYTVRISGQPPMQNGNGDILTLAHKASNKDATAGTPRAAFAQQSAESDGMAALSGLIDHRF